LKPILTRIYGNAVVLAHLRGQRRIPYRSGLEIQQQADWRVRRIVRYAAATVPYYRDLFRSYGLDPRDIRSTRDLDRLPLIDKATVAADPRRFRSTSQAGKSAIPFTTSGTTGMRLDIYHDRRSLLANIAFSERERQVVTDLCRKRLWRALYIEHPDSTTKKLWTLYERWTFIPVRLERRHLSVMQPFEEVVAAIRDYRPDAIFSYGSYLETFFRALAVRSQRIPPPRLIAYDSDGMTPHGQEFIGKEFGLPVISFYNAMESFKIGFSCGHQPGFHLHEDLCDVKIVGSEGRRLPDGEKGEVIISNLVNRGTVLLNYRLGDIASLQPAGCPCGRTLRILADLEGRSADILFLPDGTFVHPMAVWRVFKGRPEILQYQLIQREPLRFVLRLALADRRSYERAVGGVLADLTQLLGKSAVITPEFHERLELEESGKFRPVVALPR
jgi:phenylacetate-CoA ligase